MALAGGSAGLHVEQFGGHVAHLFGGLAAGLLPLVRAQPVERDRVGVGAGIAADQVQVGDRHVELVAFGVLQGQEFAVRVAHIEHFQAQVSPYAVFQVHHQRAGLQVGQAAHDALGILAALAVTPSRARMTGKQLGLGQDGDAFVGQAAAAGKRQHRQRQPVVAAGERGPGFQHSRLDAEPLEIRRDQLAPPGGVGRQQDPAGRFAQSLGGLLGRVIQVQRVGRTQRGSGRLAPGQAHRGAVLQRGEKLVGIEVKLVGVERRALAIARALLVSLRHLLGEFDGGFVAAGQHDQPVLPRKVVEQARGPVEEQRQVLFQPLAVGALADLLVGQGAPEIDLEAVAEAAPELGPGALVERVLAARQQFDPVELVYGALGFRVERANGFDIGVEQLYAIRHRHAHRPEVEHRAAHRELAGLPDLVAALVAGVGQPLPETAQVEFLADLEVDAAPGDEAGRREPLHQRVDGRDDDAVAPFRQAGEHLEPAGHQVRMRRVQVVGQDFQVREQVGPRSVQVVDVVPEPARRIAVGGSHQHRSAASPRVSADRQRKRQVLQQRPLLALAGFGARRIENGKRLGHRNVRCGRSPIF